MAGAGFCGARCFVASDSFFGLGGPGLGCNWVLEGGKTPIACVSAFCFCWMGSARVCRAPCALPGFLGRTGLGAIAGFIGGFAGTSVGGAGSLYSGSLLGESLVAALGRTDDAVFVLGVKPGGLADFGETIASKAAEELEKTEDRINAGFAGFGGSVCGVVSDSATRRP